MLRKWKFVEHVEATSRKGEGDQHQQMFQHLGGPGLDTEPPSSGLAVLLRRARRKSCESFEKSGKFGRKIHLKVAPERCLRPFFLTHKDFLGSDGAPAAGRPKDFGQNDQHFSNI